MPLSSMVLNATRYLVAIWTTIFICTDAENNRYTGKKNKLKNYIGSWSPVIAKQAFTFSLVIYIAVLHPERVSQLWIEIWNRVT